MAEAKPDITMRRQLSPLWIVPLVSLVAGIWIVVQTWLTEGPTVTLAFATAEGLEAGKTRVKMLNVDVGLVEQIKLNADASGVTASVNLDKSVEPLLREDTQFWVVRARVGAGGVSGIGTIVSGAYIEMAPGVGAAGKREFVGLESPPQTSAGAPGKRIVLTSNRATTSVGDAVLYRGFRVGRVESMEFDAERELARYQIFIDAPYDELVHSGTRFWDASGIAVSASALGVEVRLESLEALITGGVAFGPYPGVERGPAAEDGAEFRLYESYSAIETAPFRAGIHYVVAFDQSVAGLSPGAPVYYRGLRLGQVEAILLAELSENSARDISDLDVRVDVPVLIYLEPARLELPDTPESVEFLSRAVDVAVGKGMRASLQTGNLLTGSKEIALDYYPDAADTPPATTRYRGYPVIPSVSSGVDRIAVEVNRLLAKLNALPLEDTVVGLNRTLKTTEQALVGLDESIATINTLVSSPGVQQLPEELAQSTREVRSVLEAYGDESDIYARLNASLAKLDRALQNLDQLTQDLSEQPSSVIFGAKPTADPIPEARQ